MSVEDLHHHAAQIHFSPRDEQIGLLIRTLFQAVQEITNLERRVAALEKSSGMPPASI
jgi:hypothetical protein